MEDLIFQSDDEENNSFVHLNDMYSNNDNDNSNTQESFQRRPTEHNTDTDEENKYIDQPLRNLPDEILGFLHLDMDFINTWVDDDVIDSDEETVSTLVEKKVLLEVTESDLKKIEEECSICLRQLVKTATVKKTKCQHVFHEDCIVQWFQSSSKCPLCRRVC